MCQAKAYLDEQQIMEEIVWLEPTQEGFRLYTLFGETREVKARLQSVDLLKHRIMLVSVHEQALRNITAGG